MSFASIGAVAPHDPRPEEHAVTHASVDHSAHFVTGNALAGLANGCRLDGERVVDRRRAAMFGQAVKRHARAAGLHQQRRRALDQGLVHCGGNTRNGIPGEPGDRVLDTLLEEHAVHLEHAVA